MWYVLSNPAGFAAELCRPVRISTEDARAFRWRTIRIAVLWMILPKERRTIDEAEREFRRLSDRAFRDMREDIKAFGLDG